MKVLPYVYLCREKDTGLIYVGYRYANYLPSAEDFGHRYFTSNKYVKKNFNNFEHTIIAEFFDKKDALKFESQLVQELWGDNLINTHRLKNKRQHQSIKVDNNPKICALDGCGKIFTNWRKKCCCRTHQFMYSGQSAHKK